MPSKLVYEPPRGDGEILIKRAGARAYREEEKALKNLVLGGTSRAELRADLLRGLPGDSGKDVAAGGHQPVIPYPGITFKDIVHSLLAEARQLRPINFIVDYDLPGEDGIYYPAAVSGGYERRLLYRGFAPETSYEDAAPDGAAAEAVEKLVGAPLLDADGISAYGGALRRGVLGENSLAGQLGAARRAWETGLGVQLLDVPFSGLCEGAAFGCFFLEVAGRAEEFRDCYNECLAEQRRGLSPSPTRGQFGELRQEQGRVELPFWCVSEQRRQTLWVEASKTGWLFAGNEKVGDLFLLRRGELGFKIRPKALMLTMFVRLLAGEFFVHGVGGGNYEQLNDLLFERFLGLRGGEYWVCSATLYLEGAGDGGVSIEGLSARIRRMENSPEEFLGDDVGAAAKLLVAEKREMLARLRHGSDGKALYPPSQRAPRMREGECEGEVPRRSPAGLSPSGAKSLGGGGYCFGGVPPRRSKWSRDHRRRLHRRVKGITEQLAELVAGERAALEEELARAKEETSGRDALAYRHYPSFCYPLERFEELRERARLELKRMGV